MAGAGYAAEVLARAVAPGAVVHAANPRIVLVGSNDAWNVRLTRPAARTIVRVDRDPDELQALVRDLLIGREPPPRRRSGGGRPVDVGREDAGHVGMNAEQLRRRMPVDDIDDDRAPVTVRRHEFRVAEALHEHDPCARDVVGISPRCGRVSPVRQRRRVLVLRADVRRMSVQSVDLGDELWRGVEPRSIVRQSQSVAK